MDEQLVDVTPDGLEGFALIDGPNVDLAADGLEGFALIDGRE